jgi:hypothetical protein
MKDQNFATKTQIFKTLRQRIPLLDTSELTTHQSVAVKKPTNRISKSGLVLSTVTNESTPRIMVWL